MIGTPCNMVRVILIAVCLSATVNFSASASGRDSASYYLQKGRDEEQARHPNAAWKFYEKAIGFDPANTMAHAALAEVCLKLNKTAPAIKSLEALAKLQPSDKAVQHRLLKLHFDYSAWDKVIALGTPLFNSDPQHATLAMMLGKAHYSKQNYRDALPLMRTAEKLDPANADIPYLIGRMYVHMSNYKIAAAHFAQSLALDSLAQPGRYYEYALVLATAENFKESIKWFEKALVKGYTPRDDFFMNYANTLADANQTAPAIKMLKEMLQRRPQDIALIQSLAGICYQAGRYKDAIGYWDTMLVINKNDARSLYHIGLSYIKLGREDEGKQYCERAIEMEPALEQLRREVGSAF